MRARTTSHSRLRRLFAGPLPRLPRPLDACSEQWAGLAPRTRLAVVVVAVVALVATTEGRVQLAQQRWGGEPVAVFVAERDHAPGDAPHIRRERRPAALVPRGAADRASEDLALAQALPEGSVLTDEHLDPAGPGASLQGDHRAVPLPVEDSWGVTPGGWVDVWVLGGRDEAAVQVARSRPVLALDEEEGAEPVALVGLASDEVGAVTSGLASGGVLLAHAPAP